MNEENTNSKKLLAIAGLIAIVLVVGVGLAATSGKDTENQGVQTSTTTTPSSSSGESNAGTSANTANSSTPTPQSDAGYKDGTYAATGSYSNPGGTSKVSVQVTLEDGVVTGSKVTAEAVGESRKFQEKFISGYKGLVVGKKIDEISLSRVSGSSLTSNGFNQALERIREQAATQA